MVSPLQPVLAGKKVLVIGGTGRIGSFLHPHLMDAQIELTITGTREIPKPEGYTHVQCRLPDEIEKLPKDFQAVIILAAVTNTTKANQDPEEALQINLTVPRLLFGRYSNSHVILASSVRSGAVDSAYAWSKGAIEAAVAAGEKANVTVVRFGNVIKKSASVEAILTSLREQKGGFFSSSAEYYQTSFSLAQTLYLALHAETPSNSIITPLLAPIPVPFLAGYLAGYVRVQEEIDLGNWTPDYPIWPTLPPLIPDWWIPFSRFDRVDGFPFIITNFRKENRNEQRGIEVRALIREHELPRFGQFTAYLEREGIFH